MNLRRVSPPSAQGISRSSRAHAAGDRAVAGWRQIHDAADHRDHENPHRPFHRQGRRIGTRGDLDTCRPDSNRFDLRGSAQDTQAGLQSQLRHIFIDGEDHPLNWNAVLLAASWRDPEGLRRARDGCLLDLPDELRLGLLGDLIAAHDGEMWDTVAAIFKNRQRESVEFRGQVLTALGNSTTPGLGIRARPVRRP